MYICISLDVHVRTFIWQPCAGSLTVPLGRAPGPSRGGSTAMPMGSGGSAQLPIGRSAALPAGAVVYGALAGSHVLPVGGGAVRYAQALGCVPSEP